MYPWIKDKGRCRETELLLKAAPLIRPTAKAVLYHADKFTAGTAERVSELLNPANLLELRIFDDVSEFWAHRSALGSDFAWRIADDAFLEETVSANTDPFLRDPGNYCIQTSQTLDIDTTYAGKADEATGSRMLRTTGGGLYALPVSEGDGCVLLRSYIRYDENGVAAIVDYRLAGFAPQKKGV